MKCVSVDRSLTAPAEGLGRTFAFRRAIDLGYKYVQRGPNAYFNFGPKRQGLFDWRHQLAPRWSDGAMQAGVRK